MIRNYFKMKKNEWKVKSLLYGAVADFMSNQAGVVEFIKKLYVALKDTDPDEFKDLLIAKIVELTKEE